MSVYISLEGMLSLKEDSIENEGNLKYPIKNHRSLPQEGLMQYSKAN